MRVGDFGAASGAVQDSRNLVTRTLQTNYDHDSAAGIVGSGPIDTKSNIRFTGNSKLASYNILKHTDRSNNPSKLEARLAGAALRVDGVASRTSSKHASTSRNARRASDTVSMAQISGRGNSTLSKSNTPR